MQRRRDRIEKWRTDRKKGKPLIPLPTAPSSKKWSLEDDDDEDDEPSGSSAGNAADEIDPLDAYMQVLRTRSFLLNHICYSVLRVLSGA